MAAGADGHLRSWPAARVAEVTTPTGQLPPRRSRPPTCLDRLPRADRRTSASPTLPHFSEPPGRFSTAGTSGLPGFVRLNFGCPPGRLEAALARINPRRSELIWRNNWLAARILCMSTSSPEVSVSAHRPISPRPSTASTAGHGATHPAADPHRRPGPRRLAAGPARKLTRQRRSSLPRRGSKAIAGFYSFLYLSRSAATGCCSPTTSPTACSATPSCWTPCAASCGSSPAMSGGRPVSVTTTSCTGLCDQGPAMLVNGRAIRPAQPPAHQRDRRADPPATPLELWPARVLPDRRQHPPPRRPAQPRHAPAPPAGRRGPRARGWLAEMQASNLRGRAARFRHRRQMGQRQAPQASQGHRLQRRRGRARHLQGPRAPPAACRPVFEA